MICKDRKLVEPIVSTIRTEEFLTFEDGFEGWDAHNWATLTYDSNVARGMGVEPPPHLASIVGQNEVNKKT